MVFFLSPENDRCVFKIKRRWKTVNLIELEKIVILTRKEGSGYERIS